MRLHDSARCINSQPDRAVYSKLAQHEQIKAINLPMKASQNTEIHLPAQCDRITGSICPFFKRANACLKVKLVFNTSGR